MMKTSFSPIYVIKNLILRTPLRYGYYLHLRNSRDKSYDFESDKHPVRKKHHGEQGWKKKNSGEFLYRDYSSYDEYVIHQSQKFTEMLKLNGGFPNRTILEYRTTFYRRFCFIPNLLPKSALIVCLGARQGTEVEVLRDLGFKNALGIDLNPGPDNPLVRQGDFMALDFADHSVDMVYSNCVDHAFNLNKFFQEHARVLKPDGYALYDIAMQTKIGSGPFEALEWKSEEAVFLTALKHFRKVLKVETEAAWKWLLLQK
jgi:SAM-dependent methyltransferase